MPAYRCSLDGSLAQQSQSTKTAAPRKQATPPTAEKPAETTPKPETAPEQKPAIHEAATDRDKDKEERFDMTEVPPVVTHHQITVEGKGLKYTATAGTMLLKLEDGLLKSSNLSIKSPHREDPETWDVHLALRQESATVIVSATTRTETSPLAGPPVATNVAVPGAIAVTSPASSTFAIAGDFEDQ